MEDYVRRSHNVHYPVKGFICAKLNVTENINVIISDDDPYRSYTYIDRETGKPFVTDDMVLYRDAYQMHWSDDYFINELEELRNETI